MVALIIWGFVWTESSASVVHWRCMFDKNRRVAYSRYICNCTHPIIRTHWRFMHSPNWKHICLNRELKWDYVYQVFMAKSTFLSPSLHVTFGVLYKRSLSGLLYVIKLYLGIFHPVAHIHSPWKRAGFGDVSRLLGVCTVQLWVRLCVRASLLLLLLLLVFRSAHFRTLVIFMCYEAVNVVILYTFFR